jgi:hypothetical protein
LTHWGVSKEAFHPVFERGSMPRDYVADIRRKDKVQLQSMLRDIGMGVRISRWPAGRAFEHVILRAFELEDASVQWPFSVTLNSETVEQIDGAVHSDGFHCLIEAKDYSDPVNIEPVAKLRNQLIRRPAGTMGLIFARSGFTEPAKILTRMISPLNILLWEFGELEQALDNETMRQALKTKYLYAVEYAMPDYDIRGGLR